jgi:ribosomal protein S18 acetylase RimI-like enzyme
MLTVQVATAADVEPILEMMVDFNRIEMIRWTPEAGRAPLLRLVADPTLGVVGVARQGEELAGYFVLTWGFDLEWNGRDAYLTELYLRPERRGRGQARQLLAEGERLARQHGANVMHMMVRPENTVARRVYETSGYQATPRLFLTKDFR